MKDTEHEELSWTKYISVLETAREDKSFPQDHRGHASGEMPLRTSRIHIIGVSTRSA